MKVYWDSSALVDALHNAGLRKKIRPATAITRPHSLTEVFSTLTKGVNFRYSPDDAARMISDLRADMGFVELTAAETQDAINEAGKCGVRGARIHDLMHAMAAVKSGAEILFILDASGFSDLDVPVKIKAP